MTAVETRPVGVAGPEPRQRPLRARLGGFFALTKPRIFELLIISTIPVMFLAQHGIPNLWLVLWVVIGGYLSAGGAASLNMYLDRDIDAQMARTSGRPIVTGVVSAREALWFGIALVAVSTVWLTLLVNPLSAGLALAAQLFYVFVYTIWLKRRTSQAVVWGGIAGCMPVLIGWTSVRNSLSWPAVVLFLVLFFWTPPHTWPLSMKVRDDYAKAGVPVLPVVATNRSVARQIVVYSWVMVLVSLALWPVAHTSPVYPVVAAVLGGTWMAEAYRLQSRAKSGVVGAKLKEMRLFHWSITYLTLLFIAVAIDPFL
ncbi:protoheme IX farnesyltransferase [Mangrovactinospora gilvigrisea]|uniref:Protoheme IX farnesyltransferase n=1 Tax=Mangrovactinospora gilvigrisea TaxID=1428644 RepID=A0A1J7CBV5_9ACTN|nr:heme o synthase [Mangrovactinospora gilvigrisea]OIV38996.1 protoheme IX farnesyltransferase [Mangrovactinospora gilvigrisea]